MAMHGVVPGVGANGGWFNIVVPVMGGKRGVFIFRNKNSTVVVVD